jgi:aspartyl-tRNA(Asn)/glutamyl-tRNA(Gln) amidotransferase subunit A
MRPWQLSASELAQAYARRDLTPLEAVGACLERNAQVHSQINAMVCVDEAGALDAARASGARLAKGQGRGPLEGIPFTVKDNLFVRGMRATWGSRLYAEFVPEDDDIAVARLRDAGAVFLGKTNTPELALAGTTDNLVFGTTRNPWNPMLTPGGSSGGAVAATAAGIAPLALATDGGGSTRVPASFAGVFGLRPSTGRVARLHGFPPLVHDLQVVGLVTRSALDLQCLFDVVAQPNERDAASRVFSRSANDAAITHWRVRLITSAGDEPVDPQVREATRKAAVTLQALGHIVTEDDAPFDNGEIREIWTVLSGVGTARVMKSHAGWERKVTPGILNTARAGFAASAIAYIEALDRLANLRQRARAIWSDCDLLLTPTATTLPWPANEPLPRQIDGKPVAAGAPSTFAKWVNAAALPAINLPAGLSREGLPIGVQLVAPFGYDQRLLMAAAQFERANALASRLAPL